MHLIAAITPCNGPLWYFGVFSHLQKLHLSQNGDGNTASDDSSNQSNNLSRQLKPGLLPMVPELAKQFGRNLNPLVTPATAVKDEEPEQVQGMLNRAPGAPVGNLVNSTNKPQTKCQRLTQLAESMGMRVQFSNFSKV